MPFGQLVVGGPGAGKTTYCDGMHQFLGAIGRQCSVINLDPANDLANYPVALDIRNLITLEEIMRDEKLGPNGGVLFALETLEANFEEFEKSLKELGDDYLLFDCPGQVEAYTHHNSLRRIFLKLQQHGFRLVAIHLSDSVCLTQPSSYIANIILTLRGMLQLDLPHINVMTKIDKVSSYDKLPFPLDYYAEARDLSMLTEYMDSNSSWAQKFAGLNRAVADMVESFGLVSFEVLAVENKRSMMHLLRVIDKASGYVFGSAEGANDTVWQVAMRSNSTGFDVPDIQERWIDLKDEYDMKEREEEEAELNTQKAARDGVTIMEPQAAGSGAHTQIGGWDPDFGAPPTTADSGVKIIRRPAQ